MLTGMLVTMIIQSSGATTVMVVSFVNAGLMTLPQSIGVIFGANIGTTITAWIVALFGFNFNISALAIPVFGIGFFITFFKNIFISSKFFKLFNTKINICSFNAGNFIRLRCSGFCGR